MQSTIKRYEMDKSTLLEEYSTAVTPPGVQASNQLDIRIFWVLKDLTNVDTLANHVVPLLPVQSECKLRVL